MSRSATLMKLCSSVHDALNAGILDKAESFGKDRIQGLFKTFGFNVVNVIDVR